MINWCYESDDVTLLFILSVRVKGKTDVYVKFEEHHLNVKTPAAPV